jgi:hypothetical protein
MFQSRYMFPTNVFNITLTEKILNRLIFSKLVKNEISIQTKIISIPYPMQGPYFLSEIFKFLMVCCVVLSCYLVIFGQKWSDVVVIRNIWLLFFVVLCDQSR